MREKWVDFLKAIAMVAVLQDHLPEVAKLYNWRYTIFSVSLFVLMGGITAAISMEKQPSFDYKVYFWKKVRKIVLPYFVATCGYVVFDKKYFDVLYLIKKLLTFSEGSNGHMYYLVFYFQLVLIAPVLVKLYKNYEKNEFRQGLILACSAILSYLFQTFTHFGLFALGGKFLFGGSYFFVFNLGIYFYFHIDLLDKITTKIAVIIMGLSAFGYIIYKQWCLEWWSNPPSVRVIIYAVIVFLISYSSITLIQQLLEDREKGRMAGILIDLFCLIGRNSLYIYLWHMMLVDILAKKGLYRKAAMGFGEKLAVSCFILYFPCLIYELYRRGIKGVSVPPGWERPAE